MIDIHTHLLPYVDDGVRDFNEAISIIKDLYNQGVKHIFVTPHYYKLRSYLSTSNENLKLFNELKEKTSRENIDVFLYLGNEIKYTIDVLKAIEEGVVRPLKGHMFLIEFSSQISVYELTEAVHNMKSKGYIPILAHIERYENLNDIDDVKLLKKLGALIQINASSVLGSRGFFTKRWIKKLIKEDYVDFIASDSHTLRPNLMSDAYAYVAKKFTADKANKLFNNSVVLKDSI
jgi:protein-tyrosine phosphatase